MVLCTVIYSAATGVDAASGSNAPTTAHTDVTSGATVSTSSPGNTITFSTPVDLTGVLDDGSDVIHVSSTAGRVHLYRILQFNVGVGAGDITDVVSIAVSPQTATSDANVAWAIGGKRLSPAQDVTHSDPEDLLAGWVLEFESGTYAIPATATPLRIRAQGTVADGAPTVRAAAGAAPKITWSDGNHLWEIGETAIDFDLLGLDCEGLQNTSIGERMFENSGSNFSTIRITDCTLKCRGKIISASNTTFVVRGSYLESFASACVDWGGRGNSSFRDSTIIGGTGTSSHAFNISGSSLWGGEIVGCVVRDSGGSGIEISSAVGSSAVFISNNVFHANGVDGIRFAGTSSVSQGVHTVENNVFTQNGGYGVNSPNTDQAAMLGILLDYNAFGSGTFANAAGQSNGLTHGANLVQLGVNLDPYTDAANDDYTTNDVTGGGAALRDAGRGLG